MMRSIVISLALVLALSGCVSGTNRRPMARDGGVYVWQSAPPIPGVASSAPETQAASFTDQRDGLVNIDASQSRELPGGWKGPVYERVGFSAWRTFYRLEAQKPGELWMSRDLREWRVVDVPDDGMNLQVLDFGTDGGIREQSVPFGVGTTLMLKSSWSAGRNVFFFYRPR